MEPAPISWSIVPRLAIFLKKPAIKGLRTPDLN